MHFSVLDPILPNLANLQLKTKMFIFTSKAPSKLKCVPRSKNLAKLASSKANHGSIDPNKYIRHISLDIRDIWKISNQEGQREGRPAWTWILVPYKKNFKLLFRQRLKKENTKHPCCHYLCMIVFACCSNHCPMATAIPTTTKQRLQTGDKYQLWGRHLGSAATAKDTLLQWEELQGCPQLL